MKWLNLTHALHDVDNLRVPLQIFLSIVSSFEQIHLSLLSIITFHNFIKKKKNTGNSLDFRQPSTHMYNSVIIIFISYHINRRNWLNQNKETKYNCFSLQFACDCLAVAQRTASSNFVVASKSVPIWVSMLLLLVLC